MLRQYPKRIQTDAMQVGGEENSCGHSDMDHMLRLLSGIAVAAGFSSILYFTVQWLIHVK